MRMQDLPYGRDPESADGHLILGSGNLSHDLRLNLETAGINPMQVPFPIVDAFRDFDTPDLAGWKTIWLCTGARHSEAKRLPAASHRHNFILPRILMDRADQDARICFFSTADCANPEYSDRPNQRTQDPLSEFAMQKLHLEGLVLSQNRPLTAVVRMSSLYGLHHPGSTFPGRLLRTKWADSLISLPSNEVSPTPTDWAAHRLISCMDGNLWNSSVATIHHLAPTGSIGSLDWARLIFEGVKGGRDFLPRVFWDEERPRTQNIGCTLNGPSRHWLDLWQQYFRKPAYQGV